MVYKRGEIFTKVYGYPDFKIHQSERVGSRGMKNFNVLFMNHAPMERYLSVYGRIPKKAFVIENLDSQKSSCFETDLVDMTIDGCKGDIQARMPNANE